MDPQKLLPAIIHSTVSNLSVGGTYGLANGEKIENPYDTAMVIDEIRFHATGQLIDFLRCKLDYGQQELTADYIPLDLFGKTLNWEGMHVVDPTTNITDRYTTHVWRLPTPLYLPRGGRLTPRFKYQDDWGVNPAALGEINVTFAGRRLPSDYPDPSKIEIPYIARFGQLVVRGTDFTSSEADLKNPWPEELSVERMLFALHVNDGQDDGIFGNPNSTSIDTALSNINMRMHDSLGAIVLRDPAAFGDAISVLDRSWPLNTVLRSGAYYIVDGNIDAAGSFDKTAVWIALHGTRVVSLDAIGV